MFKRLWTKIKAFLFRNTLDHKIITAGENVSSLPEKRPSLGDEASPAPAVPSPLPSLGDIPDRYLKIALEITGSFEGVGFGQVTGDGDDQGMSCGILQWCYGQGSLQTKLLKPYIAKYSANKLNSYFNINVAQTAFMGPKEACSFARTHMLFNGKVKPDYKQQWINLLLSPEMKEIQVIACGDVAKRTWTLCREWDMKSMKAFCWFFDILTQNGSIKIAKPNPTDRDYRLALADAPSGCRDIWRTINPVDVESATLFIASHQRAKLSRPQYIGDVFSRKGTIALGKGFVHGSERDFTEVFEAKK